MHAERFTLSMSGKRMTDGIDGAAAAFGVSLLVLVFSLAGCAGPKKQVTYNPGEYQQVLDRQKAGLAPSDDEASSDSKDLSPQELQRLGDLYLQQGNPALAIVQYQNAVEADPSLFRIHYKMGDMFLKKGLPQDAIQHFQEVLKHDDHDALTFEGLGEAYFRIGKEEEAEASFRKRSPCSLIAGKRAIFSGCCLTGKNAIRTPSPNTSRACAFAPMTPRCSITSASPTIFLDAMRMVFGHFSEPCSLVPANRKSIIIWGLHWPN